MGKPTEAQKQAAQERRQRMKELSKRIAAMSDEERQALTDKAAGVLTIEGRTLSPKNSCMIYLQAGNEPLTVLGGFLQWKKVGRSVKKGSHGFAIWVPCKPKETAPEAGEESSDGDKPGFILGTVFDISQTEERAAT